jgi:hypothetical protein
MNQVMGSANKQKRCFVNCHTQDISILSKWIDGGLRLYALLDACDEGRILTKIAGLGDRAVSLYRGKAEQDFFAVAPYIASADSELVSWITSELSGTPWGYFVAVPNGCDLAAIRKHFRKFLMVVGPDGKELYFRFYDPRIIRTFLESSSESELAEFFGPIVRFVTLGDGVLQVIERADLSNRE